jgi:hypothetical protein
LSIRSRKKAKIIEEALSEAGNPSELVDALKSCFSVDVLKKLKDLDDTIQSNKIEGFVALFDILGFQSMVEHNELEDIVLTYERFHDSIPIQMANAFAGDSLLRARNYSDTILLYTTEVSDRSFRVLLMSLNHLFMMAAAQEVPIRGAITVGDFYASDDGEIGKPIIDAYRNEKKQEWLGCWIAEECISRLSREAIEELTTQYQIVRYHIPFKEGQVKELYALNWMWLFVTSIADSNPVVTGLREPLKTKFFLTKKPWHGWAEERKHNHTRQFIDFIFSLPLKG